MKQTTRIFIVDDHPMIKEGLCTYISDSKEYEIIGMATNGVEAFEKLSSLKADIILMDIQMPLMNGIELAQLILENDPDQKIIILTMYSEAAYIQRLLQIGVMGYILKDIGKAEFYRALEKVAKGNEYYSKEVTDVIMNKLRLGNAKSFDVATDLSEREKEILQLILKQKSNQEIAKELYISSRTVEAHKRNMLTKTNCKNLAGLVMYALENEVVNLVD